MEEPETQSDHKLDKLVRCSCCGGRGVNLTHGRIESGYVECILCHGTGRIPLRLRLEQDRRR
jgi:DnaJ-class molecular chaperone